MFVLLFNNRGLLHASTAPYLSDFSRTPPYHVSAHTDFHEFPQEATAGKGVGTHGANWGAKLGGGYYLHVANQFANFLTIIDPDPNGDNNGADAFIVGRILLANGSQDAGVTDGVGGQGIKPIPNMYDGWIQDTVALSGTGQLSAEVQGWIDALTAAQRDPSP